MDTFKVGQAPWETGNTDTFAVGKAPWETGAQPAQTPQPSPSESIWQKLVGQVGGAFQGGVNQVQQGYQDAQQATNPLQKTEAGLGMLAGGVKAAFSPLAPVTAPIGSAIQAAGDKLSDTSLIKGAAGNTTVGAGGVTNYTPNFQADRPLNDISNVATVLPVAAGALNPAETVGAVSRTASAAKAKVSPIVQQVKDAMVGNTEEQVAARSDNLTASGVKDATPDYNPKLINQPAIKGVPRVQESTGVFGERQVTPTEGETAAGHELSKVEGYNPKASSLEKYNLVKSAIATKGQDLVASLKAENILRPPQELIKVVSDAVEQVPEESLILAKTDPLIDNYMRVVKTAVNKNDGTLAGELAVRKAMDDAYENARGKLAFGSEKVSALDELHTAARNAINEDLISHAKSTYVKASLRSQSNLFRASDVLLKKPEKEGNSNIEKLTKKYPKTSKIVKKTAGLVGLGEAVHLGAP